VNPDPVSTTDVPPAAGPDTGATEDTTGGSNTCPDALTIPTPHVFDDTASQTPSANPVARDAVLIRASTCAGVNDDRSDTSNAATPATCGAAILVPLYDAYDGDTGDISPESTVDTTPNPGAATSTTEPKFENDARLPPAVVAATAITPAQFAGRVPDAAAFAFPAAATTTVPRDNAPLIAV
jgi:hypothetical protein